MRWLFSLLLLAVIGLSNALSTSGSRLLVILDDVAEKEQYSKLFGDLSGRGFQTTFESPKSEKLALFELGGRAYDHLLILPSKLRALGPKLTPQILLQFVNAQGNILLALDSSRPTPPGLVSLLLELDIHLAPERSSVVVDHFNYDALSAPEKHDVLLVPRPDALRPDVKSFFKGSGSDELIAFPHGVGQTLGNESPLLAPILRAPRTAYSHDPKEETEGAEDPFAVGAQLALVSTVQARNSARFTVVGAAEMLQDTWFDAKVKSSSGAAKEVTTANRAFAKEVSGWTFNEIGVLKVGRIEHYLNEEPKTNVTNPKIYRIKNKVTYAIELSEYSWDHYMPFVPAAGDEVQLEFSMLSPFHRLPLLPSTSTANSTTYTTSFTIPDQHGIFNFMVEYRRPFLSNVEEKKTVTVRHFAHNEWPRSWEISNAWPWITGIAVTVVGWLAFVAIWMWSAPVPVKLDVSGKKVQ